MPNDDEKAETKFSETFHFKFLFAAIVVMVLFIGLYYVVSPYQNCLRDTFDDIGFCVKRTGW